VTADRLVDILKETVGCFRPLPPGSPPCPDTIPEKVSCSEMGDAVVKAL